MNSMNAQQRAIFEQIPERKLLAIALYGEARGESDLGKAAVACVILNRAKKSGKSIAHEILKPFQFSCFLPDDPNFKILMAMAVSQYNIDIKFKECERIATLFLESCTDFTGGATNYFNPAVVLPSWAKNMTKLFTLGRHEFYREVK